MKEFYYLPEADYNRMMGIINDVIPFKIIVCEKNGKKYFREDKLYDIRVGKTRRLEKILEEYGIVSFNMLGRAHDFVDIANKLDVKQFPDEVTAKNYENRLMAFGIPVKRITVGTAKALNFVEYVIQWGIREIAHNTYITDKNKLNNILVWFWGIKYYEEDYYKTDSDVKCTPLAEEQILRMTQILAHSL